ncbi:methyltransferase [Fluoribacter gormanii]|uniref:N5-glutamine S-adenosyl-L-methionine-dependent methyltransferase n=1 Tax=Fluoribacter gormanii TaxID=464 RepID=A0A377GII1_9GAMM|nr:methyltransferase [Fluoribacter gormanii]KTD00240.1 N5-glutamine S-adenosyl-L-methionine-dependent methyltransferase [Fluoribacter gormanii]MCW8472255.1 methyltransferase [Fluoribacter gormanii]SIQ87998.1 tRNA1(Val) A37 N6-methylase TrmN6 [Fluoribacter gormanii]STO24617.1 N5-glutamine S-adenosyl-L-methionine-dependent methyltransferase [Fluoribacter gormanii]
MIDTMQSELNVHFTYNYKQPEEYHFSLDSIHLAKFVATQFKSDTDLGSLRILDLCAGCGVIGIELSWHLQAIRQIDFIEVQDIYTEYFHQNIATVNRPELQLRWHLLNYDALHERKWEGKFDLTISNPPYFQPGHGVLSPSQFKNRCRFYLDSSFESYIRALENSLANNGKAYFLLRSLKHHGLDLFSDIQKILKDTSATAKIISHIRGSDIVLLEKLE